MKARIILAIGLSLPTIGAAVEFSVRSEPLGVIDNQQTFHDSGAAVSTPVARDRPDLGLLFSHWALSPNSQHAGCTADRCSDATGQSLVAVAFDITADTIAIAHYMSATEDSDGDGLADALELRFFGDLTAVASNDVDLDGFTLSQELSNGLNPRLVNVYIDGAPTGHQGPITSLILLDGHVFFHERSLPLGLLSRDRVVPLNTTVSTLVAPEKSGTLRFAYWRIDDAIKRDPSGAALFQAQQQVVDEHLATAHYFVDTADSDADGIPDWYEYRWFQALNATLSNQEDGDLFSLHEELNRGLAPTLKNIEVQGGATTGPELQLKLSLTPLLLYTIQSSPVGIFPTVSDLVPEGTEIWTPVPPRQSGTLRFSYWDLNGVKQTDLSGAALQGAFAFSAFANITTVNGTYFLEDQDSDADGLPDWFEQSAVFGSDLAGSDDPDGDGLSLAVELVRGFSPTLAEDLREGGVVVSAAGPSLRLLVFRNGFEPE